MPFDYMKSDLSKEFNDKIRGRFDEAFIAEVKERAKLMFNLRVPMEDAIRRISENIEWEFDETWTTTGQELPARTTELVTGVYAHLSR